MCGTGAVRLNCLMDTNIWPVALTSIIVTPYVSNKVNQAWQDTN